jgi:hypothetical protein
MAEVQPIFPATGRMRQTPDADQAGLSVAKQPVRFRGRLAIPSVLETAVQLIRAASSIRRIVPRNIVQTLYFAVCIPISMVLCVGCGTSEKTATQAASAVGNHPQRGVDMTVVAVPVEKLKLEAWLAKGYQSKKPIRFLSGNGVRFCCDLGNTALEFRPDGTIKVFIDGYAPTIYVINYTIHANGEIEADHQFDGTEFKHLYLFEHKADLYLGKSPVLSFANASNLPPGFPRLWPLKYEASGEWRGSTEVASPDEVMH